MLIQLQRSNAGTENLITLDSRRILEVRQQFAGYHAATRCVVAYSIGGGNLLEYPIAEDYAAVVAKWKATFSQEIKL
jgi:hypothetical protein